MPCLYNWTSACQLQTDSCKLPPPNGILLSKSNMVATGKAWYNEWFNSPFYHKLYFERDQAEAKAFIQRLVAHLNPPPGSLMVDLACGRGRHSKILAAMGFHVTGIDLAPDSIKYAKQFENENLEFYQHDMRLPCWMNYYDYAFNFFTSFGYFRTRREHEDAIRTIANSLRQTGTFVLDYLNVHYAEDHLLHSETKELNGTIYEVHRWHTAGHFFKKIVIRDESLLEPMEFTEQVAKFSLGDFTDMLSYHGMQINEVFGSYDFGQYDARKTPRLILIAKKRDPFVENGEDQKKRLYSDGRMTDALT